MSSINKTEIPQISELTEALGGDLALARLFQAILVAIPSLDVHQIRSQLLNQHRTPSLHKKLSNLLNRNPATTPTPKGDQTRPQLSDQSRAQERDTTIVYDTLARQIFVDGQPSAVAERTLALANKITGRHIGYLELLTSQKLKQQIVDYCRESQGNQTPAARIPSVANVIELLEKLLLQDTKIEPHRKDYLEACALSPQKFPVISTDFDVLDLFKAQQWIEGFIDKQNQPRFSRLGIYLSIPSPDKYRDDRTSLSLGLAHLKEPHQKRLLKEIVYQVFYYLFEKILLKPTDEFLSILTESIEDCEKLAQSLEKVAEWGELVQLARSEQHRRVTILTDRVNSNEPLNPKMYMYGLFPDILKISDENNKNKLSDCVKSKIDRELARINTYPATERPQIVCRLSVWCHSYLSSEDQAAITQKCESLLKEYLQATEGEQYGEMNINRLVRLMNIVQYGRSKAIKQLIENLARPQLERELAEIDKISNFSYQEKTDELVNYHNQFGSLFSREIIEIMIRMFESIIETIRLTQQGQLHSVLSNMKSSVNRVWYLAEVVDKAMSCPVKAASDPEVKFY